MDCKYLHSLGLLLCPEFRLGLKYFHVCKAIIMVVVDPHHGILDIISQPPSPMVIEVDMVVVALHSVTLGIPALIVPQCPIYLTPDILQMVLLFLVVVAVLVTGEELRTRLIHTPLTRTPTRDNMQKDSLEMEDLVV